MTIGGIGAAASGFRAGSIRQRNAAHNIANLNTESATRLRTEQVATRVGRSGAGGPRAHTVPTKEEIDLATELMEQRIAKGQVGIAAHVFKISNNIEDSILDILA